MKKLLILLVVTCFGRLNAQSLSNTTWSVYDGSNVFFLYFNFDTDTVAYSSNNITYTNVSTYTVNGTNFAIRDIPGGPCPNTTGLYTFLIQNNLLKFSLISDSCANRSGVLSNFKWTHLASGIKEVDPAMSINVYPNPASDRFYIDENTTDRLHVRLYDLNGKQIMGVIVDNKSAIDVSGLCEGIYNLTIETQHSLINRKLAIVR